jgi:hypothetical protein
MQHMPWSQSTRQYFTEVSYKGRLRNIFSLGIKLIANGQRGLQNVGLFFHLWYRTVTQSQINYSRQYRSRIFNYLHQYNASVALPERLFILWNTKVDLRQRIRLLLFATITNFLYQPILRHCLEIICRTIEKSGWDFRPRQKTFLQIPERLWRQFMMPKVNGITFPRGAVPGREADCSNLTAELKNTWSHTVTPPYSFVVLISLTTRKM